MAKLSTVTGLQKVKAAFQRRGRAYARGMERGLKRAGLRLQRDSMKLVPIDTGNLRAGAFTRASGSGFQTEVRVGYVAAYAVYVHENLEAAHGEAFNKKHADKIAAYRKRHGKRGGPYSPYSHKRKAVEQAKFLETPLRQNAGTYRQLVRESMAQAIDNLDSPGGGGGDDGG